MRSRTIGRWSTTEILGKGGNATVFRAVDSTGNEVALKVLDTKKVGSARYRRFRDEISVAEKVRDIDGILPVLDFELPSSPTGSNPAWLAMPVAQSLRGHLGEGPGLERVVGTLAPIAIALAELVSRSVFHRDIKPENLYWHEGSPAVGDFGLVTFPGKEPVTSPEKKLGPIHYIAPEMVSNPTEASPGPADVWSLAKTIWVLASDQRYPLPGPHRADEEAFSITAYANHSKAYLLDALLARCTQIEPTERPSMSEVAEELVAWLEPSKVPREAGDVQDLGRQVGLMEKARAARSAERNWAHQMLAQLSERIVEALSPIAQKLRSAGFEVSNGVASDWFWSLVDAPPTGWGPPKVSAAYFFSVSSGFPAISFYPCMAVEIYENGSCRFGAAYLVQHIQPPRREVMALLRDDLPRGAPIRHEETIKAFQDHLNANLRECLARFVAVLEDQPEVETS